jgi:hypothetical protein
MIEPKNFMKDIAKKKKNSNEEVSMFEKFTKDTLEVMSKEELRDAVESLQLKLEAYEKQIEELKRYAEIGKKYEEDLKAEATKFVKLVEGEKSPMLRLIDKADIDTLREIAREYREKAQEEFKPSAKHTEPVEELSREKLEKMSYQELLKLKEKFTQKEV